MTALGMGAFLRGMQRQGAFPDGQPQTTIRRMDFEERVVGLFVYGVAAGDGPL
ncbi:unnamed protein product [Ectocarpus sp. CCAP 1310/34]|nr:unnamed protein product [Ectocarpus sp. CCAP 1310/34]